MEVRGALLQFALLFLVCRALGAGAASHAARLSGRAPQHQPQNYASWSKNFHAHIPGSRSRNPGPRPSAADSVPARFGSRGSAWKLKDPNFKLHNPISYPAISALEEDYLDFYPNYPDLRDIGCPPADDILPCLCVLNPENETYLHCLGVESADVLESVFLAEFPNPQVAYLHIDNSPFLRTLGDIFNGISFLEVDIYGSGIEFISEYAFIDSLNTLEYLHISDSYLHQSTFPFLTLPQYSNLNTLYLYGTQIDAIPALYSSSLLYLGITNSPVTQLAADTFQGLPRLTNLFLLHNSIAVLGTGVFGNLAGLRHVDLSNNGLTYLEPGTFPLADGQMSIVVRNNSIAVAAPGTFVIPATTIQFVVFVDVAYNALTVVDEAVFGEIYPYLNYMYLDGNPLECGCDVTWLITKQNWTNFVGGGATCADGVKLVDLDPQSYLDNC